MWLTSNLVGYSRVKDQNPQKSIYIWVSLASDALFSDWHTLLGLSKRPGRCFPKGVATPGIVSRLMGVATHCNGMGTAVRSAGRDITTAMQGNRPGTSRWLLAGTGEMGSWFEPQRSWDLGDCLDVFKYLIWLGILPVILVKLLKHA